VLGVLATETFLLPDLESGTICHRNCDTRISALGNNLETCWNRISLGLGVGKWVPASAWKAKAGMVHSVSGWTRGVQVNCEIPWEHMPYLSALEVCLRRGAIQITFIPLPFSQPRRIVTFWLMRLFRSSLTYSSVKQCFCCLFIISWLSCKDANKWSFSIASTLHFLCVVPSASGVI